MLSGTSIGKITIHDTGGITCSIFSQRSQTFLPAADHMAQVLAEEDQYADLNERCRQKILELEDTLSRELKERVALVAYRI